MSKTLWGVEGGYLTGRVQSHMAVKIKGLGFYFTFAVRAFGHFARVRLYGRKPFVELRWGLM